MSAQQQVSATGDQRLTINQLVERYGNPREHTIRKAVVEKQLPAVRVPGRTQPYLIRESDFVRWLEQFSTATA